MDDNNQKLQKTLQTGYWNDLLNTLKREVAIASPDKEPTQLYYEIGHIYLKELGQLSEAKQYFLQGAKLNQHN